MSAKTLHVFLSNTGDWAVKREGASAEVFPTQQAAIKAAKKATRESVSGQFVVHGQDGRIRQHGAHGLPHVQDPPKKSRLAGKIGRAVGKVALDRIQSDPACGYAAKK